MGALTLKAGEQDVALHLMRRAQEELAAVTAMLDETRSIGEAVTQRAIELALKAVLATSALDYPFTHDIDALAELCEAAGMTLPPPPDLDEVDSLTPYAVAARYDMTADGSVERETAKRSDYLGSAGDRR